MRSLLIVLTFLVTILFSCKQQPQGNVDNDSSRILICDTTSNGGIQMLNMHGGKANGYRKYWHPANLDTTLDYFIEGHSYGPVKVWGENGQSLIEGHNFNGVPSGLWKYWNKEGRLEKLVILNRSGVPVFKASWNAGGSLDHLVCDIQMVRIDPNFIYTFGTLHEEFELYTIAETGDVRRVLETSRLIESNLQDSLIDLFWQTKEGLRIPFSIRPVQLGTKRTLGDLQGYEIIVQP